MFEHTFVIVILSDIWVNLSNSVHSVTYLNDISCRNQIDSLVQLIAIVWLFLQMVGRGLVLKSVVQLVSIGVGQQ